MLARAPRAASRARESYGAACVDDAQDLTAAHLELLRAVYGTTLPYVTLAGDARQGTRAFSGGLGEAALRGVAETFVFEGWLRGKPSIANTALRGADPRFAAPHDSGSAAPSSKDMPVAFARAQDVAAEARIVADFVTEAIGQGTPAREIAIVARTLRGTGPYVDALLARGVDCDLAGDGSIFELSAVEDALAALFSLADPFRHDYLTRTLEAPWMRLADATVGRLCAESSQPQALLFEMPDEPQETRGRWDRRRDFRLARNVTRGDADLDLTPVARERLAHLRAALERWERLEAQLDLASLVRAITEETVLATLAPGARGAFDAAAIERFLAYVDDFARARPLATLHDLLEEIEAIVDREESLLSIDRVRPDAVAVLDVDAAKSCEFDVVIVAGVAAGAFPRYYVPEVFLYTPKLGIVPKDNVGDCDVARTAKFTYTMNRTKAQSRFIEEERRAFYVAASRARNRLVVTAAGRATKGVAAPEILEELRRAGLAGAADLDRRES